MAAVDLVVGVVEAEEGVVAVLMLNVRVNPV